MRKDRIGCILISTLALGVFTGCNHKDLEYCEDEVGTLEVVFDWRNASSADPASMGLYMFDQPTGKGERFSFSNKHGGTIRIEPSDYDAIAYNNDNTDWALLRNTSQKETFEIRTPESGALTSSGVSTRAIPLASGTEDQTIVKTPGMLWTASGKDLTVIHSNSHQQITLYPEESVCHYTVKVLDVTNADCLSGKTVDGTLSGLAGGFHPHLAKPSSSRVIMPFDLTLSSDGTSLEGNFLTFGKDPDTDPDHTLTLYMLLNDGSKRYYTYDVTDQVNKAADPHHVLIIVRGLDIPKTEENTGGFVPTVNDWHHENVDIKM